MKYTQIKASYFMRKCIASTNEKLGITGIRQADVGIMYLCYCLHSRGESISSLSLWTLVKQEGTGKSYAVWSMYKKLFDLYELGLLEREAYSVGRSGFRQYHLYKVTGLMLEYMRVLELSLRRQTGM